MIESGRIPRIIVREGYLVERERDRFDERRLPPVITIFSSLQAANLRIVFWPPPLHQTTPGLRI